MNALSGYALATSPASNAARKVECDEQADHERQRNAEQAEIEARIAASDPWPIDYTAGHRMGLYRLICERGD